MELVDLVLDVVVLVYKVVYTNLNDSVLVGTVFACSVHAEREDAVGKVLGQFQVVRAEG